MSRKHVFSSKRVIPESWQRQRFVDEVHDNRDEVLLSEIQQSEGRESCVEESTCSIKETCADHVTSPYGNKEACANNLRSLPSGFFQKDYHSYERKEVDRY